MANTGTERSELLCLCEPSNVKGRKRRESRTVFWRCADWMDILHISGSMVD